MRRVLNPLLLLGLLGSRADATSIRQTIPLPPGSDKKSVAQQYGHAKEGDKRIIHSGTVYQGDLPICAVTAYSFSCIRPFMPVRSRHYYARQTFFDASFYISSFCNKAPPSA